VEEVVIMRTRLSCTGVMALLSFALATPALATTTFDMEGVAPNFYPGLLVVADGPLTLTVTPLNNSSGFVVAGASNVPLLGSVSLIGSTEDFLAAGQYIPLRFSFDQPIDSITFNFGDAGGDDDGTVEIRAYRVGDMFDTLLGSVSDTYPAGFGDGKSLTLDFAGANYFVARTFGSNNENSMYWEIGAITRAGRDGAVPEPSTWAMMLAGLLSLGRGLRRAPHKRTTRAQAAG
jgi:adhesin HecA-like repeat protein